MYKRLFQLILILFISTNGISQIPIENSLKTTIANFNDLEEYDSYSFTEIIKYSEEYLALRKSVKEGLFVLEKFNSKFKLTNSVNLSEKLNVNGFEIIETKSLNDRLIIVTLSANKKEKTQTCNAYTLSYENMLLSKKTELKTQFYKKEKMKVQIVTSENNNVLFKISEAENKEYSDNMAHYIIVDKNLIKKGDYSETINTATIGRLKKGIFVLAQNIVLSNTCEVITVGITKDPMKTYFSGIIFKYSELGTDFYEFDDKLPWGLNDGLIIKLDEDGLLYGANYFGQKNDNFMFFSFDKELMKPISVFSKIMDKGNRMEISNIIPLANKDIMMIGKSVSSSSTDNGHAPHYRLDKIVVSKIDKDGVLIFQESIAPKSSSSWFDLGQPISVIVNGEDVTLVYNSTQFNGNERALVGSTISETGEMETFKILDYDNKSSNNCILQLYQVGRTRAENSEVMGLCDLKNSVIELILINLDRD